MTASPMQLEVGDRIVLNEQEYGLPDGTLIFFYGPGTTDNGQTRRKEGSRWILVGPNMQANTSINVGSLRSEDNRHWKISAFPEGSDAGRALVSDDRTPTTIRAFSAVPLWGSFRYGGADYVKTQSDKAMNERGQERDLLGATFVYEYQHENPLPWMTLIRSIVTDRQKWQEEFAEKVLLLADAHNARGWVEPFLNGEGLHQRTAFHQVDVTVTVEIPWTGIVAIDGHAAEAHVRGWMWSGLEEGAPVELPLGNDGSIVEGRVMQVSYRVVEGEE